MNRVLREMIFTFWLAFLGAMVWVTIIMSGGVLTPDQVLEKMSGHLLEYGSYFILLDFIVGGLLVRWSWIWWRKNQTSETID